MRIGNLFTLPAILQAVRYWGWFIAKVAVGEWLVAALLWLVNRNYRPYTPWFHVNLHHFGYDLPYTSLAGVCFLLGYLVVYFAVRDQQYRCRVSCDDLPGDGPRCAFFRIFECNAAA